MDWLIIPFRKDFKYQEWLLVALGALFFLPFLSQTHLFDWDEINFAESAREMIVTGDYFHVMINYVRFWEKPPLFFWMQALSMHAFGVNEFAARLPNALCGIGTLLVIFRIGKRYFNTLFGMIWALLYIGSLLPHVYFRSGIIDPVFNLFIFLGLFFLIRVIEENINQTKHALLAGLFTGLAVLTKGPVGLLIPLLTFLTYWIFKRFRPVASLYHVFLFALVVLLVSGAWFGYDLVVSGPWFLVAFIRYQIDLFLNPVAGHQQFLLYHFVVVAVGCVPISIFALPRLIRHKSPDEVPIRFAQWMRMLFWVVMILFTIVTTKIVHYSSMAYLPLSFLATLQVYDWVVKNQRPPQWVLVTLLTVGAIFGLALTALPVLLIRKDWLMPPLGGKFEQLAFSIDVPMLGWEWLGGVIFLLALVVTYLFYRKKQLLHGLTFNALLVGFTLSWYAFFVVPKVERYTQGPAIDFYKSVQGEDVYILTYKFKSYADHFYARKLPWTDPKSLNEQWLLQGYIDKPVYVVIQRHKKRHIQPFDDLKLLYEKGGFAFYKRETDL